MKKKQVWHKTKFPGVRYREHPTRRHGIQADKYFTIVYRLNDKVKSEAIGWASGKWSAEKAAAELSELRRNQRRGSGPQTMAEKRELEQQRREAKRKQADIESRQNITFGDFFEKEYFPVAQTSKKQVSYQKESEHFNIWLKPVVGDLPFRDISQIQVEKIKRNLQRVKRSPRLIKYVLTTFRQIWNLAKDRKYVDVDSPSIKVKIDMPDNNRRRYLTEEEAKNLLSCLKSKSIQVYNLSILSLDTGCRFSEAAKLRWNQVDTDGGVITYIDTKKSGGTKSRTVPLTARGKNLFESLPRGGSYELVFPDKKGSVQREISKTFYKCVNELKLNEGVTDPRDKIVFHSMRHTFASRLVQAGVGLYLVSKLMGHSSSAVTERYSHLSNDSLVEAVSKMENAEKNGKILSFQVQDQKPQKP